jgi:hypothetical protein
MPCSPPSATTAALAPTPCSPLLHASLAADTLTAFDDRGVLSTYRLADGEAGRELRPLSAQLLLGSSGSSGSSLVPAPEAVDGSEVGPAYAGFWEVGDGFVAAGQGGSLVVVGRFSGACQALERAGPAPVVSVGASPFFPGLILAASADGSVSMYRAPNPGILRSWGAGCWGEEALLAGVAPGVAWSEHRPGVFYVCAGGKVMVVDLMADDSGPMEEPAADKGAGVFASTKGKRTQGQVMLVVGGRGGLKARQLSNEMLEEKKTLSEENEMDFVRQWLERV